ncbi:MAG: helix-turn-helix domain-containing protein [Verrucomicrobiota bacterium]
MQSIGERLEEARKRKGISIREAAEATKIRTDYLHKYESNQFDLRLPEIYVRGFLRNYAVYLGLPANKIIEDYDALGIGEDRAHRGVNREIYGRMDLSAPAKPKREDGAGNAPAQSSPREEEPSASRASAPGRTGSSIAGLDRILLLKTGTLGVIGLVLLLLVGWGLFALFSGGSSAPGDSLVATAPIHPGESTIDVVTTGPVSLAVTRQSDGTELFRSNGELPAGFRLTLPKVVVSVQTSALESLQFDYQGRRTQIPNRSGPQTVAIDLSQIR